MYVIKRDGRKEDVLFDKITFRIQKLCYDLNMEYVDPSLITIQIINGLYPGVSTVELDNLAAEIAASMTTKHPDYAILAARIAISNLHKETKKLFSEVIHDLYHAKDTHSNEHYPLISEEYYRLIQENANKLNSSIIHDRDFYYNYIGFKTLERNYLLKIHGKTVERPQHMLMRVAVGIHRDDIDKIIETYNYLSDRYFMHSPQTLLSACTIKQSLASCYLLTMTEDSIDGICDTLTRCALISKSAGRIGLNIHCIRAKGTPIAGTLGESNGLVPMIKVYNNTACYIDQEKKTSGTLAIYIEPWHADVFEFLNLKKSTGKKEYRAKDLSYGLWIPDLFMQRVLNDDIWTLMCPHQSPGLAEVCGKEFEKLYVKYEKDGRFKRQIRARDLWTAILMTQVETGIPYMLYKDHCNNKSNQQNVGTIKCSNLCTEVIEYSSPDEIAVCHIASIAVNMFVDSNKKHFDFEKLKKVTKVVARNLDNMIDVNHYPLPEALKSNIKHRPIGIGIQGLADAFLLMRYPFESEEAQKLNIQIFETLYYGALEASCEIAQEKGTYETYKGSPISKGILQYDMWNVTPTELWNWKELKAKIAKYGIRNSLLIALSPTSLTAQILGNNRSIVPYTNNMYTMRVSSRTFQVVNPHLLRDLTKLKLWDENMKNKIIANNGSVQNIDCIPLNLKELYKTVWEMSQKTILKMAADRGAFIDQSQSLDVYMAKPTMDKLTSMHFYGWKMGLKSGMYYLHTNPTENIIQFTMDEMKLQRSVNVITRSTSPDIKDEERVSTLSPSRNLQREEQYKDRKRSTGDADDLKLTCSLEDGNACLSCGS